MQEKAKPQTMVDSILDETKELDAFVVTEKTFCVDGYYIFVNPVTGGLSWSKDHDANTKQLPFFVRSGDPRETENMKMVREKIESTEVYKRLFN